MATVAKALTALVKARTTILGSNPTRFYPTTKPQGAALPAAAYQRIDEPRETTHDAKVGLARARYQITIWGTSFDNAEAVENELAAALYGYKGTSAGVVIGAILPISANDGYEPTTQSYMRSFDIRVIY